MVKYSTYDINTLYCGSTISVKQSPKVRIKNLYVKHLTIWLSHPVNAQSNPLLEISTHMTKIQIKTYTDTYAKPLSLWKGILQHSLFVNIVITFHLGVCYLDQYGGVLNCDGTWDIYTKSTMIVSDRQSLEKSRCKI